MKSTPKSASAVTVMAAATALMTVCASVNADENQGFYAGGGVGRYDIRIDNAEDLGRVIDHYSTDDTAYKLFGGWRFNPYLALEGDYINLGTNRDTVAPGVVAEHRIDGWEPSLVGTLPLGPIELFAEGGEYFYKYRRTYEGPAGDFSSASDTFNHFTYGGGVGVTIAQRIPIRLEYQNFDISNTNRSNALWLTGAFRF